MNRLSFSRTGFIPGMTAALVASVIMLLLGKIWGAPVPTQLLSDRFTALVPVEVFGAILGQLESSAKPLTFALIFIGQLLVGGLAGGLLTGWLKRGTSPQTLFGATFAVTLAALGFVFAPLGDAGLFGRNATAGVSTTTISFAIIALVFAGLMISWLAALNGNVGAGFDASRRRVVSLVAVGVPVLLAAVYLGKFFVALSNKSKVAAAPDTADGISPAITPVDDFYVVSKNFVDPSVSASDWKLSINGLVEKELSFTYDEIRSRPATKHIATLQCISNEVGGDYISNGSWTGFPLKQLLDEAGVKPGVVDVVFHADDGYADSIPLEIALDPDTFVVHELGGAPLTKEHGYPLRVLVPNIYGMKNAKWLTEVTLVDNDFKGFWQKRGWSDSAIENTMSRIDFPRWLNGVTIGTPVKVGGIAFAGSRGVSAVEVSTDGGRTWNKATVEAPLSPLSWVRWTYLWTPTKEGKTSLVVRATDGTGKTQTNQENPPLPNGSTGYHLVQVRAVTASS